MSDEFITRYQEIGKAIDPVLQYVLDYHAPANGELVLPAGTWKQKLAVNFSLKMVMMLKD